MSAPALNAAVAGIAMPDRFKVRPLDSRGFPVPFFAAWFDAAGYEVREGTPGARADFRVLGSGKMRACFGGARCWICGAPLGRYRTFVLGPMCLVNRTTGEPGCHTECAEYAARACPFLTRPKMRRNERDKPVDSFVVEGGLDRNPGATLLFTYEGNGGVRWMKAPGGGGVFRFPDTPCAKLTGWREGRAATRAEIMESIDSGMPLLDEQCDRDTDPASSRRALAAQYDKAAALIAERIDP